MTYLEPLTTHIIDIHPHNFLVLVQDAGGRAVARVKCSVAPLYKTGAFGTMEILQPDGSPRQKARALVLLTRRALEHAASLDIRRVITDVPAGRTALIDFARRMSGLRGIDRPAGVRIIGDLAQIRSRMLDRTDDAGEERD